MNECPLLGQWGFFGEIDHNNSSNSIAAQHFNRYVICSACVCTLRCRHVSACEGDNETGTCQREEATQEEFSLLENEVHFYQQSEFALYQSLSCFCSWKSLLIKSSHLFITIHRTSPSLVTLEADKFHL